MKITDNRKPKQEEPFEIKKGDTVMIDGLLCRFTPVGNGNFVFISMGNCSWTSLPMYNTNLAMSNDKWLNSHTVIRVTVECIITD